LRIGEKPLNFVDAASGADLAAASRPPMKFGALFADFDRDGRPDLFTCNGHLEPDIASAQLGQLYKQPPQLFRNIGVDSLRFAPVEHDLPAIVGRGCAYLDYDGDGDLDLVVVENNGAARLYRNDSPVKNDWVRLHAIGNGTTTNRDGIGAEISVESGGATFRWYISPAHGYLSQSELTATFGLTAAIDRVTIRWPGSDKGQEWRGLKTGAMHILEQQK
jgi:hypothetical protein